MGKISYSIENGIARITMDDGKANSMNWEFFEAMHKCLDQAEGDCAKALVITGRKGFFSGGLDLKLRPTLPKSELAVFSRTFARTMLRIFAFPIPTIAALSGHAVAGGAVLTFACDLRFAVNGNYRIQMNETAIGIPLPYWVLLVGSSAIPSRWMNEALLHAKAYSPAEALERGILSSVAEDSDALSVQVNAAAERLASLNLPAYAESKNNLRQEAIAHGLDHLEKVLAAKMQ